MNQFDLAGKRAVVTGGAQGIGFACAARLLESGACVTLWDQDGPSLECAMKKLGSLGAVYVQEADVTDFDAVAIATAEASARMGGIDIMVNNAGIAGATVPTWEYPVDEWHRVVSTDLDGVFYCCRQVVPHMLEGGYGRIVNVASIAGKEGNPNACAYSAAKAGVIALTKSLGKELAEHDIAVNCITPAAARTRIFDQMSEEHIGYMLSKIPRGRFVEVDEIAGLVAWLSSSENTFTTGAVFDISGGRATY